MGDEKYGKRNASAPAELLRFDFLIGRWRCEAKLKLSEGEWLRFDAEWVGRYILDGHAIADEYRMMGAAGELIVLGMNVRTYDTAKQLWNIRWLNALAGDWTDLVPGDDTSRELGGVRCDGSSVSYAFREPVAKHAYTRATYTNHSGRRFTWAGEKSEDGTTWSEFMVVDAHRVAE